MKKEKRNKYYLFLFLIGVLSGFSCHNELSKIPDNHQDGIAPASIEQITDVFELKYGEVKECNYDGQLIKFSIIGIEDDRQRCDVLDSSDPEIFNKIRIHATLRMEDGENTSQLKVSSQKCGPFFELIYDGTDIQQVWDLLNIWQYDPQSNYGPYFDSNFTWAFGEGTLINNTPLSIYMASAYPYAYKMNDNIEKSLYEFIFIITNQKTN
jgi:hypothetical protein